MRSAFLPSALDVALCGLLLAIAPAVRGDAAPTAEFPAFPDVDAMAQRPPSHQEIYRKIRDDALAAFAKRTTQAPTDEKAKTLIRLEAYLWVWGDLYQEGLWAKRKEYSENSLNLKEPDWFGNLVITEVGHDGMYSSSDSSAAEVSFAVDQFLDLKSGYPAAFRMEAAEVQIADLAKYKVYGQGDPTHPCFKAMPAAIHEWGQDFREMLKAKWPHDILFHAATHLMCGVQCDQATLDAVIAEIDAAFTEADPGNPLQIAMDGNYQVMSAWSARGNGWANSVSDQGWKTMADRLAKADEILEAGYAKHPEVVEIPLTMLDIELGQGQGRDRMELWFSRAVKADPECYAAYKGKEWYLQPRWYGSEDDLLAFGQECVKTGKWSATIPLILPVALAEASQQDSGLYAQDKYWGVLEPFYREYLKRYPHAIGIRTNFAKHAFDGGHLDVAREQFALLGNDYDRQVLRDEDHARIMAQLGK